eukprot:NODE_29793_length_436_cov_1.456311.p1 GENE.NODE_29793_length_436_cov_1.456311~~NODE_29793_length_436_cov_1.456311.p1  ORF type:complete len:59 (-),score=9.39 NODE_29793_length_436_cov_1.456311:49-225(-)
MSHTIASRSQMCSCGNNLLLQDGHLILELARVSMARVLRDLEVLALHDVEAHDGKGPK